MMSTRWMARSLVAMVLIAGASLAHAEGFDVQRCINMGNALDAPEEGAWGHTIQASSFRYIAEAGFDTVRIPVRWSAHTGDAPTFTIDPEFFDRVTEVIEQALANELQVILNIHHFNALNESPTANSDKLVALWHQIATRYQDLPDSVYFEVINEPTGNFKGDLMRTIVTRAFKEIRKTNPTRTVILGGDNWSGLKSLSSIPRIDDPNQVYTFHYYDPFRFTHQKASWTNLVDSDTVHWGNAEDREALLADVIHARQMQDELGVPLFLGEIGAYQEAPYNDVVEYTAETRRAFEAAGIRWCVWSFTATFPFFDQEALQWDAGKLEALGLSSASTASTGQSNSLDDPGSDVVNDNLSLDAAFNALRRQVGHDGDLMMSPYPSQLGHYGRIKVRERSDTGAPGGNAVEVTVRRPGDNPWDAGLSGPLTVSASAGDTLVMAYWARGIEGADAKISNAGLQLNREPYSPLSPLQPAGLTDDWQRFVITAVADRDYAAEELGYTLQVAGVKQTIQVGPVLVLNLGQGVEL